MEGGLLTARQVADMLEVSYESVLRWARDGDLPAIYLPKGGVRFRRADIDAVLVPRTNDNKGAA